MSGERKKGMALLRRFGSARILVIGDVMLDRFVWGKVSRISPEAPVPVVQFVREEYRPGGAGNVVQNIIALGGRAIVCGVVGRDTAGRRVVAELKRMGADVSGIVTGARATTAKTRIIAHQQQVVRLDQEELGFDPKLDRRICEFARRLGPQVDAVVVSDYGKGVVSPRLLAEMAAQQEEKRGRRPYYLIDPKQNNFLSYRKATLIKPNQQEAALASGIEIADENSLRAAGARLLDQWQAEAVLITRGEQGMSLFSRGGDMAEFPAVAREVYDVTGAGDTVVAVCALALAAGATLEETAWLANHGAGVVVGKVGTATLTREELLTALDSGMGHPGGSRRRN